MLVDGMVELVRRLVSAVAGLAAVVLLGDLAGSS